MKEPQDKVSFSKACCWICSGGHARFAHIGQRRVRRTWKNYLQQEAKRVAP